MTHWTCGKCTVRHEVDTANGNVKNHSHCAECGIKFWYTEAKGGKPVSMGISPDDLRRFLEAKGIA